MSDDFRFDDDDDFNFDDDFDFGDDFGDDAGGDDLEYDQFSDDVDLDVDNFDFGDDEGDELEFIEQEGGGGGGPSRTFLLIAGLLIIILLAGVVLLILALTNQGDSDLDITRTAIAQQNETTEALIFATQTQSAINAGLTQTATLFTATPSPTPSPTETNTPDLTATQEILNATGTAEAQVEQTSVALTALALTALPGETEVTDVPVEETEEATPGGISAVQAAQMTATALANLFNQTPTVAVTSVGTTTTTTTTGGTTSEMPDTGLFDEVGADNAGIFFLMAFGLVGVIIGSRRLRKRKRR